MKIPKPILERRRSIRIDEALPFRVGTEGYEIQATSLNISSTGVMCFLEKDIPVMTKLSLAIPLDGVEARSGGSAHILRVKGVVVRKEKETATERFQVAIFFSDMNDPDRHSLDRFISSRLKSH